MTERSIFLAALDIDDPAERSAYVDRACGGDVVLRGRVEGLLTAHQEPRGFMAQPAPAVLADAGAPDGFPAGPAGDDTRTGPAHAGADLPLDFLAASDRPGSLGRLGHYEVEGVVGRGGMGVVLKAFDENLHRVVAVKVMVPQLAASATARQRFAREARAQAAVTHDHIVTIHAVEEASGLPYLVMQYVDGVSLQDRLDRTGPLRLAEVLRIGTQAASGLAAAHKQGLVHRDVKPANVLLENGVERVKLTDFGLARAADDASLTQSGMIAGTPQYMSPEQAEGKPVDHRSDLFSLGSVLYAMCTGRPPFRGSTSRGVLKRVCEDTPTPLREANPEVPEWLAGVIAKLHAKDPADRYQSAAEVAELLGRKLAELQHPSQVAVSAAAPAPAPVARPRRHRWSVAAAVLALLTAGLGLTEAAGVTKVRATVIRIFTPDGTLVVEADDPDVKVAVEGNGDLVITGAGVREVRLPPGSYRLRATKAGQPVALDRDLVTITRGDRLIVKVSVVGAAPAAPAIPRAEPGAFVVLTGKGVEVRKFNTLAEAVQSASDGDTIEIRGDGPFVCGPLRLTHALTIRAGARSRPVLQFAENLQTDSPLVLEGLELQRVGQKVPQGSEDALVLAWESPSLHLVNCRFREHLRLTCVRSNAPNCVLRNCEFLSPLQPPIFLDSKRCLVDNCLVASQWGVLELAFEVRPDQPEMSVQFRRCTLRSSTYLLLVQLLPGQPEEFAEKGTGRVRVDASGTVFDTTEVVLMNEVKPFLARVKPKPEDAKALLLRMLAWRDRDNLYTPGGSLVLWNQPPEGVTREFGPRNLADWKKHWAAGDGAAVEGRVEYQGGDLLARLSAAPEKLTPDDFRLRPDSAGYRAGKDGKDLGADVDLVGPGPAYERWKKTPEYQQWLKETGQVKK